MGYFSYADTDDAGDEFRVEVIEGSSYVKVELDYSTEDGEAAFGTTTMFVNAEQAEALSLALELAATTARGKELS